MNEQPPTGEQPRVPFERYKPVKTGPRGQWERDGVLGDGPSHDTKTAFWLILIGTIVGIALSVLISRGRSPIPIAPSIERPADSPNRLIQR